MKIQLLCAAALLLAALPAAVRAADDAAPLTPKTLQAALAGKMKRGDGDKLAERVRAWFGADLAKGDKPKVEDTTVAWAIELPDAKDAALVSIGDLHPPSVEMKTAQVGSALSAVKLTRLGKSDIYAGTATFSEGETFQWTNGPSHGQMEVYTTPPESRRAAGVPEGKLVEHLGWKSTVFSGTTRDWWVYVPAQYTPGKPACVMVFQDGAGPKGYIPPVFDNMIAKGELPVTVGVFIQPGTRDDGGSNRSFEYDTLSDQYSRMLLNEILPEVEKTVALRHDAASRAIAGISSGGICAFTVAWERPDAFSKVLSWVGSFTNIASGPTKRAGGHNYEALVRKTEKKPIRVFLQDGENDLDNANGNWPLANQTLARSLAFAGYDFRFVFGHGFHSDRHGRSILPDSLRWLWRGYTP